MNQQRARRFRAAQEAAEQFAAKQARYAAAKAEGLFLDPPTAGFDSNCITPGTVFMGNLRIALEYYILDKFVRDPGWKNIQVILSDASVPGEGEHKIMTFIRHQRACPDYDPRTSHVLYGLDADLIMLALATHEPNFRILREDVQYSSALKRKTCEACGKPNHTATSCFLNPRDAAESLKFAHLHPYIFLDITKLREHLKKDFSALISRHGLDFERIIDDWVFMIYFVGNDFLPHLPSLEIREGAIDLLVKIYKEKFLVKSISESIHSAEPANAADCYLTCEGTVAINKVKEMMNFIGVSEDAIFVKRKEREDLENSNRRNKKSAVDAPPKVGSMALPVPDSSAPIANTYESYNSKPDLGQHQHPAATHTREKDVELQLKQMLNLSSGSTSDSASRQAQAVAKNANQAGQLDPKTLGSMPANANPSIDILHPLDDESEEIAEFLLEEVHLWQPGYRERYYRLKFDVATPDDQKAFRVKIVNEYLKGLCWVFAYYYSGCPSWEWYFPYHYAPFAADFELATLRGPVSFDLGTPFRPFDQLLGVLPAASSSLLPPQYAHLMHDPLSEIIDFYPLDFQIDMNGKQQAWKAVILLPFIDSGRLLAASMKIMPTLNQVQLSLNSFGPEIIYVSTSHGTASAFSQLHQTPSGQLIKLAPRQGVSSVCGSISFHPDVAIPGSTFYCNLPTLRAPPIRSIRSLSAIFHHPLEGHRLVFEARLLAGEPKPFQRHRNPQESHQRKQAAVKGLAHSMAPPNAKDSRARQPSNTPWNKNNYP